MATFTNFTDVHTFDGKWNSNITTKLNNTDKQKLYDWLLSQIDNYMKHHIFYNTGRQGLQLVMTDTMTIYNFDAHSKTYADDILVELCLKILKLKPEDRLSIYHLILEQMNDMYTTGKCAIGRSTRLFQIYTSLNS